MIFLRWSLAVVDGSLMPPESEQTLRLARLEGDAPWVAVVNAMAAVIEALADRVAALEAMVSDAT